MNKETGIAVTIANLTSLEGQLYLATLIVAAYVSFRAMHWCVTKYLNPAIERNENEWDDILRGNGVFRWLANLAPALVVYFGVGVYRSASAEQVRQIILAYMVVCVTLVIDRLLSSALQIYQDFPESEKRPIKGYIQLAKLLLYVTGTVAAIAVLLNKSPWGILGGIGALTTVLLLLFRDSILSLVASIQLTANDLLHLNDWIVMPECGIDGEVIDITLHTVIVRNFDQAIVSVPTYKLIAGSFQNWRGMKDKGGRRIKRSLLIDQTSIRFCDEDEFTNIRRLKGYLEKKREEFLQSPANVSMDRERRQSINRRALTNLGTFRAYILEYLREQANIRNEDMTFMVRQLPPSPEGLPLEIYVFSSKTALVDFECIQSDIFDHLLAALPYFDLRVFQYPTGRDLQMVQNIDTGVS